MRDGQHQQEHVGPAGIWNPRRFDQREQEHARGSPGEQHVVQVMHSGAGHFKQALFVDHFHSERARFVELRPGIFARDHIVCFAGSPSR